MGLLLLILTVIFLWALVILIIVKAQIAASAREYCDWQDVKQQTSVEKILAAQNCIFT